MTRQEEEEEVRGRAMGGWGYEDEAAEEAEVEDAGRNRTVTCFLPRSPRACGGWVGLLRISM